MRNCTQKRFNGKGINMKRLIPVLLTLLACLTLALVPVPTSSSPTSQAPRIRGKNGTSTNWSGYAVETSLATPQSGAVSDVKGQWIVPSVTCNSSAAYASLWVGIDGYSSNSVEQTGTDSDCSGGSGVYYAWYEMYPKPSQRIGMAIRANDSISAEVAYNGGSRFTLTMHNNTTGANFTTTLRSNKAARSSAEWILEAPYSGGILPLANFGTASFGSASATLNGHTGTISDSAWQNDAITMANSSGGTKASVSGLSSGGTSFNVTWVSSN
jgi:hypothetical protein